MILSFFQQEQKFEISGLLWFEVQAHSVKRVEILHTKLQVKFNVVKRICEPLDLGIGEFASLFFVQIRPFRWNAHASIADPGSATLMPTLFSVWSRSFWRIWRSTRIKGWFVQLFGVEQGSWAFLGELHDRALTGGVGGEPARCVIKIVPFYVLVFLFGPSGWMRLDRVVRSQAVPIANSRISHLLSLDFHQVTRFLLLFVCTYASVWDVFLGLALVPRRKD